MSSKHKQFSDQYSSIFQDASVVSAYVHRPPYPTEICDILAGFIDKTVSPCRLLDVGCGTGQMTSMFRHYADQIDAVDISAAMIEAGKQMPYGDDPTINWIVGEIETVELHPPYALIVAAASLHWMDWNIALPRFAQTLSENGHLALVESGSQPHEWDAELKPLFAKYSMNRDFQPYNMLTVAEELTERGLFRKVDVVECEPVPFRQPIEEWIEAIHSRNGFSRDRMESALAAEFDQKVRELIVQHCPGGEVEEQVSARVIVGKPLATST